MSVRKVEAHRLHPRHVPVELARRELVDFIIAWHDRHGITYAEEFLLAAEWLRSLATVYVEDERGEG